MVNDLRCVFWLRFVSLFFPAFHSSVRESLYLRVLLYFAFNLIGIAM